MKYRKTSSISGTILTLIIVYFIYLVAKDREWKFLSFLTGAYLFIVLGFFALIVLIILLLIIIPLFMLKKPVVFRRFGTRHKRKMPEKDDSAVNIDFKVRKS